MKNDDMQNQTGLVRRGATYHIRIKVPADLRDVVPQAWEIVRSLGTKDRREAESRLHIERVKWNKEFERLRASRQPPRELKELHPKDIENYREAWLRRWLVEDEESRLNDRAGDTFENTEAVLLHFAGDVDEALISGDTRLVEKDADRLLAEDGIKLDKHSESYKKLAYALLQAASKALELIEKRQQGKPVITPLSPPTRNDSREQLGHLLTYWGQQAPRKPKTAHEFTTAVKRFTALHGNIPAGEIRKSHVVGFKDYLIAEGLARGTVKKQLASLAAILQLATDNDKLQFNPARGVKLPKLKVEQKPRVSFEQDDLKQIFSAPVFVNGKRPLGGGGEAAYWIPLIAIFTGARLGEIGQLRIADVKTAGDIHYFDITDEGEGNAIKAEASRRRVPVHPQLVQLGLLKYAQTMAKAGTEFLFPGLKGDRMGQLTGNWSKWWGRYLRRDIGISDTRKTFHSFRHTFKDACREAGINQEIHDALTGHAAAENEGRGYGGDQFPLRPLVSAIRKIEFPIVTAVLKTG